MKKLILFLAMFFAPLSAFAQSTTVSGQVTDAGAQSWNNGTVTATLIPNPGYPGISTYTWTGGTLNPTISGTLSATGSYSISVPSSANISPSGSTWSFKFCPQASAPCFNVTPPVVIAGGTQTVNATPPAILINLTTAAPPISAYSTSEVTGAVLGSQFYLLGTGIQVCSAVSGNTCTAWGGSSGGAVPTPGSQVSFGATVSPLAYGAKWDGKWITDGATTATSSTYTCPNSDCNFTSADLGKLVISTISQASATPPCNGASCGAIEGQGFICTINNANSIVIGSTYPGCTPVTAAGTCATGSNQNCNLAWATQDDSTAINNAATAAWNNGNKCLSLELPAGIAFFSNPILNVTVNAGSPCAGYGGVGNGPGAADFNQTGPVVYGQGAGTTILIPYNFSPTTAVCTANGNVCNGATPALIAHDFQISGIGQSGNSTTNNTVLWGQNGVAGPCTSTNAYNLAFNNWMSASTGTIGFQVNGGCVVLNVSNVISEQFGNTDCKFNAQSINLNGVECFGSGGAATNGAAGGVILAGTQINSTNSFFGNSNAEVTVLFSGSGPTTWNSFGDLVSGPQNNAAGFAVDMNATTTNIIFTGSTVNISNTSGAGQVLYCSTGATCNVKAYATTLAASGTGAKLFNNAGTFNFYDACANTLTQGGSASAAINIFGSCSVTGTTITAAKLVLSAGWGTTAAWSALSGTTQQVFGTITASGTGQAANPTITYTFPTPFPQAPYGCFALQVGGTQAVGTFASGTPTATGVTLTYSGTPVAGDTIIVQIQCWNP